MIGSLGRGLAIALAVMFAAGSARAEYSPEQMKAMLLAHGNKFEVDKDNNYKIIINWRKEKRSQIVFLADRTEKAGGLVIHEIFSPAADLKKNPVDGALAVELLRDAATNKLGGWQIKGNLLNFTIMLPEPFTAAQLNTALEMAAGTADDQELKMSGSADEL